jgi:hypothetical protein
MATKYPYTYTAASGGEKVIIDFNDSMYKVSGDSGVIFNIKKDDIEKISNMINAGNIEKLGEMITMGNIETSFDATANTPTLEQKQDESKTLEQINGEADSTTISNSTNVNATNDEVVNEIARIAELYNKIITTLNNAIGIPPTDNANYDDKLDQYKVTLKKYNLWSGNQDTPISNITDNDVDSLSTNAINATINDSVAKTIGDEKNIINYFDITSQINGGNVITRVGGVGASLPKPETVAVDESKDARIAKLRKLIDNHRALIDKINYEVAEFKTNFGEERYLKSSSKLEYDRRINALTKQINDANAAITTLLGPDPQPVAAANIAPAPVSAAASAQLDTVPASAAASAQLDTAPASVPAPAASSAPAQLATESASSAEVVPASVPAPAASSAPAQPAAESASSAAVVPADPYSNLIDAFTDNVALYTELAKLDTLSTDDISITIGGITYQIKFKDPNTLTEPVKKYYIQLFKRQIFITVKARLLESLYKYQAPLFDYNICTDNTKTVDATNQSAIIKDTLCKVINPILVSLFNYNNKLQNVVNNQANYAVQEQYYKNTNKLIETLRKERNYISGNKDANEHIDKLKEQRKKLESMIYNHYLTLYTELGDLDKSGAAIKNAETLQVNDSDTKALIDPIKTLYGKIKADYSKYRKEFYNNYKKYGSWKQTFTPGRFRGGENKTRRTKTNGKKKTRKI